MNDILAHEHLVGNFYHLVFSVFIEDYDVVDVRTVTHELVFLQTSAHKAFLTVDIEFLVRLHHFSRLDGVEVADFGETGMVLAVFKPSCRHLHHVREVAVDAVYLRLYLRHQLVGFVFVEFQDALHLDFHQAQDVVLCHLSDHLRIVWREPFVYMCACSVHVGSVLEFLVLIYALLDEYLFERREVQLFEQLRLAYLEFLAYECLCALHRTAQHVADGEELWFVVLYHAAVWRYVHLAIGEGV